MKLADLIIGLYPFYYSVEAVRNPRVALLKHWLVFWLLWLLLMVTSGFIETFIWWLPFIGMFETLKLVILISAYRPGVSDNLRSFILQPMWTKSKRFLPKYLSQGVDQLEKILPQTKPYRTKANQLFQDLGAVFTLPTTDSSEVIDEKEEKGEKGEKEEEIMPKPRLNLLSK